MPPTQQLSCSVCQRYVSWWILTLSEQVRFIDRKKDRNRRNKDYLKQTKKKINDWGVYCKATVGFLHIYEETLHYFDEMEEKKPANTFNASSEKRKDCTDVDFPKKAKLTEEEKTNDTVLSENFEREIVCCTKFCLKPKSSSEVYICSKCKYPYHRRCVEPIPEVPYSCGCHRIAALNIEFERLLSWTENPNEFKRKFMRYWNKSFQNVVLQLNEGCCKKSTSSISHLFRPDIIAILENLIKEMLPMAEPELIRSFILPEMIVRTISQECKCAVLSVRKVLLERVLENNYNASI
ncbi:uncharacterized protein [Clytia hemisphaerica]|uniref:uncharacterized protein isoform X4 n=1 Tax=Clytia hemisphaerica TaxID=252671 RepID=UPI0034D58446